MASTPIPVPNPRPRRSRSIPLALAAWACIFWLHCLRSFVWNLRRITPTISEEKQLVGRGVANPILQSYLVWRRSLLLVMCLPVSLLAIFDTADSLDDFAMFTPFGKFWMALQILTPYAMPSAVIFAAMTWMNPRLSRRFIALGWAVSFVGPLLLCLLPAPWIFKSSGHEEQVVATFGIALLLFTVLCFYLPLFAASMAFGVQRACLRLKTLVPQSVIPG